MLTMVEDCFVMPRNKAKATEVMSERGLPLAISGGNVGTAAVDRGAAASSVRTFGKSVLIWYVSTDRYASADLVLVCRSDGSSR